MTQPLGAPDRRHLVVNADDYGMSPGVSCGILEAHKRGIVTSASLMVRSSTAPEAVAMSREYPRLGLGLHLDLGEWVFSAGEWRLVYEVVPLNDAMALGDEVQRQLDHFRVLVGRDPTHLDSHQHFHLKSPVLTDVVALARELTIPVRYCTAGLVHVSRFYGQTPTGEPFRNAIDTAMLVSILRELPIGVSELGCHPGYADDLSTVYREERSLELLTLCDPVVRAAIEQESIILCSFADVAPLLTLT